jgi:hypothetical protein
MKRITLMTICLFLIALAAKAQSGQVKGLLTDSSATHPLEAATVALLNGKDSSLAATAFSNQKGAFSFDGVAPGSYRVYITFLGYKPVFKSITVTAGQPTDLGTIQLKGKGLLLNEVEIVQEVPPVVVKQDTLEFNAGSFKTRENAMTEDLLKKLPGVTVDKDGTVTAQGQQVKRVLVDGKPFFGDDPKLATKNLPADIIDKIQLIDAKSDQAQFTGIDDGVNDKVINITIKKDKKKGVFGRAAAGYGTDERFSTQASLNSFRDNRQLSFLGSGNNVNNLGYTFSDAMNFSGGGGGGGGGRGAAQAISNLGGNNQTGITRNWNAGFNYNQDMGDKLKINASYFVNDTRTQTQTQSDKQTSLVNPVTGKDTTYYYDQNQGGLTDQTNHRVNMKIDYKLDSLTSFLITPTISYNSGNSVNTNGYQSLDQNHMTTINGGSLNTSSGTSPNVGTNVLYRQKFNKPGRTISTNLQFTYNTSDKNTYNKSTDDHLDTDSTLAYTSGYNRLTTANSLNRQMSANITYTEPLMKDRFLEFNYVWNNNYSSAKNLTYDSTGNGKYAALNDSLSNVFDNTFVQQQVGFNIRTVKFKYNYTFGLNVKFNDLENNNVSRQTDLRQRTVNWFPTASFNYDFSQAKRLRFRYNGSSTQPTVQQLQPLPDLTNSLYVQQGNPDLKPSFTHNFNLGYNGFNRSTFSGFFGNIQAQFIENKIVNANSVDTSGKQYTKPMNANGAFSLNGFGVTSVPFKKLNSSLNISTSASYGRDVSFSGAGNNSDVYVKSFTKNFSITERLDFNYTYKELFDFSTSASINYAGARYDQFPTNNTNYFNYGFMFDFNVNLPLGFIIGSDVTYTLNAGRAAGYNVDYTMLNAFVSKSLFKKKQGLIKLQGYDLLKQNVSISRTTGENYIQDTRNMVLQQYFMISFTYFLNKFGGNQGGSRRGPGGGMRMMGAPGGGGGYRGGGGGRNF